MGEHQDIITTSRQNSVTTSKTSTQSLFSTFFGFNSEAAQNRESLLEVRPGAFFNTEVYIKRIQITAETFLIEANQRGVNDDKDVFCHVVGLGLGVWQFYSEQGIQYLKAWTRALCNLKDRIPKVKNIDFSWIAEKKEVEELRNGKNFGESDIKITFSRRNPFAKLSGKNKDKLIVAMFAWDGNSYVGNEYWDGMLSASGDPAAACCSLIPELLNPDINDKVLGDNLHVASVTKGLLPLES